MRKNFNSVQMLETSEVCNKYSKSVSYETLVIGAATIGREYKQTRRVFLSSADKPLSAVGTLTSLPCNSVKVVESLLRHVITRRTSVRRGYLPEKCTHANEESLFATVTWLMRLPRRIQRMLFVMTIPALALIFTLIATAESQAEVISCVNGKYADGTACEKCGDNCNWSFDTVSGKLNVSGSGNMYDYTYKDIDEMRVFYDSNNHMRPWSDFEGNISTVQIEGMKSIGSSAFDGISLENAFIDDGVEKIGNRAFGWSGLNQIDIPDSVVTIGDMAFAGNHFTSIDLGDSLTTLRGEVFWGSSLKTVIIPDTLQEIGIAAFGRNSSNFKTENLKLICRGNNESCKNLQNKLSDYEYYVEYHDENGNYGATKERTNLYNQISIADIKVCGSDKYYWSGTSCNNKQNGINCSENWKRNEDFCNRIRYTPAEAAEVLRDDNTNEVTITFKK